MRKLLVLLIFPIAAFAQKDVTFWFAAPEVQELFTTNAHDRPIYLRITTFGAPANVTVSIPANPGFVPINSTINANSYLSVDLTPYITDVENSAANVIANKGILIQSTAEITAYYEVLSQCQCNPELFALKGRNALGTEFLIPSQNEWPIDSVRMPNARSGFNIVATENNTTVSVTPSKPLIGRSANQTFSLTLNKGETYSAQALYRSGFNLLNGSKVSSDKPIAITAYDDLLMADGPCADLAGDQLVPSSVWGNEFVVVRGALLSEDKIIVSSLSNGTIIYANGSATPLATINAGGSLEINFTLPVFYLKTNKPVSVYHYTGINCEIGSAVVPKLNCNGSQSVSVTRSFNQATNVYITTKNGFQSGFLVNGNPSIITAADFQTVPGTAGAYVYCKKILQTGFPSVHPPLFPTAWASSSLGYLTVIG